jgi:mitogen-activated protein kinase organizer 1
MQTLAEAKDSITSLQIRDASLISGSVDGRVRTYDLRMGRLHEDTMPASVTSVQMTQAGDSILVGTTDSTLRLLDTSNGKMLQSFQDDEFKNKDYRLRSCLCLNDSIALSGADDGRIWAWELLSGKVIWHGRHGTAKTVEGNTPSLNKSVVSAVAFCDIRKQWASAGGDGKSYFYKQHEYYEN